MALSKMRRDKLFDFMDSILLGAKIPRKANQTVTRRRRAINPSAKVPVRGITTRRKIPQSHQKQRLLEIPMSSKNLRLLKQS